MIECKYKRICIQMITNTVEYGYKWMRECALHNCTEWAVHKLAKIFPAFSSDLQSNVYHVHIQEANEVWVVGMGWYGYGYICGLPNDWYGFLEIVD